jgi:penicillin-binding protein 1B
LPIRLQIPRKARLVRFFLHPVGKTLLLLFTLIMVACVGTLTYLYIKYDKVIDEKLRTGPFQTTSMIFGAPEVVRVGDETSVEEIVEHLRQCGYSTSQRDSIGWYNVRQDGAIEIFPKRESYLDGESGVIKLRGGRVTEIISLRDNTSRTEYLLEPELITNLYDRNREKRRVIRFEDMPRVLVNAVISIEDKHFFHHSGFDPLRVIKAAYVDIRAGRHAEGASTLTMQLARSVWLSMERTWERKLTETLITLRLEQKLTKEEILELYANTIYLGRRGSFSIHGFGQGAQAYFGKDVRKLSLPEAALLAGLIQRPAGYNPYRNPERAKKRRDLVLFFMRQNGHITAAEYDAAVQAPVEVAQGGIESTDAPYFVDLVNNELQRELQDHDFQSTSYRVYTTLDMDLQRDAAEAVRLGMQEVDTLLKRQARFKNKTPNAQVGLVALDATTGEVKALVGGRHYGVSQLNHVMARRQPGSIFKPFVFAAALNTAIEGGTQILTPTTQIVDEPTTFWFDDKPYEPGNFRKQFYGTITLRYALAHSVNVATVKVAEAVGYDKVAALARASGLGYRLNATPSIALGAYEATPLDMAGSYTIFANNGTYLKPSFIREVQDETRHTLFAPKTAGQAVLDPRVSYLMVSLMEEVLRSGTGAGARARGFRVPAAGKTGTSHDGWFAGFTSKLICVVWVGFDDNSELNLEGSKSALPIWTEFMKRAHQRRQYRRVSPFVPPAGVVSVEVDRASGRLAAAGCGEPRSEVFIAGTEPLEVCGGSFGTNTHVASWETGEGELRAATAPGGRVAPRAPGAARNGTEVHPDGVAAEQKEKGSVKPEKRKGLFGRFLDIFK